MSTPSTIKETKHSYPAVMRGKLAVQVESDDHCEVIGPDTEAEVLRHQLKQNRESNPAAAPDSDHEHTDCSECHLELVQTDGCSCPGSRQSTEYVISDMTSDCVCPIFEAHDCLVEIDAISGRTVLVTVTAPDRDAFREFIADLQTVATSVIVKRLCRGGKEVETINVEIDELTPKRREAVETAIEMGYYNRPQDIDLAELAEQLGITKSAVSQRLNAVERELITAISDENGM